MNDASANVVTAMWAADAASQSLGIKLASTARGEAKGTMTVRPDMVNGHGIAHGGFIFTLADSAFALACNSTGDTAVAAHCQISFLEPARLGDTLTAVANEHYKRGRQALSDVVVTNQDRVVIAHFRGQSHSLPPKR